jgi:hypothetical protein
MLRPGRGHPSSFAPKNRITQTRCRLQALIALLCQKALSDKFDHLALDEPDIPHGRALRPGVHEKQAPPERPGGLLHLLVRDSACLENNATSPRSQFFSHSARFSVTSASRPRNRMRHGTIGGFSHFFSHQTLSSAGRRLSIWYFHAFVEPVFARICSVSLIRLASRILFWRFHSIKTPGSGRHLCPVIQHSRQDLSQLSQNWDRLSEETVPFVCA